jgi:hypothetical protein
MEGNVSMEVIVMKKDCLAGPCQVQPQLLRPQQHNPLIIRAVYEYLPGSPSLCSNKTAAAALLLPT